MNNKGTPYEDQAAALLISKGYQIKARNWHCARLGEIDIIAEKDGITVFVEVRGRANTNFLLPQESITTRKIARIIKTAASYMKRYMPNTDFRFDVISIVPGKEPEHIQEAFSAENCGFLI